VRHRRRPAAAAARRLGQLADLALRHQRDVLGDLAQRAREHAQLAAERDELVALRVPGRGRQAQVEQVRHARRDGVAVLD